MKQFTSKIKRALKPDKTTEGISLTVLELADDALRGIPIPGAKGGIGAVLDLIKGIHNTSRNSATLAELEKHIRFLTELLEPLRKIDGHNLPPGLEDEVGRLSTDLETIASNVKSKSSAGVVRRFFERHEDENDLDTFAQNLGEALDRFHLSQTVRQTQDLHLQRQGLRLPRQELLVRERSALLIPPLRADNARYDSSLPRVGDGAGITTHNISITTGSGGAGSGGGIGIGGTAGNAYVNIYGPESSPLLMSLPRADYAAYDSGREDAPLSCLEGTRVAILAEIMSWLESTERGTPPIYWLNGLAGIGKSTIAKTTAEQADEKGMLGGSFFFSRSDGPLRDPKLVFPTLAFQLAHSHDAFKNMIGEALRQDGTLGHKELLPQLEGLILTPLGKLDSWRTTLIILDALDECEENGAATILRLLLSHATRIPFLRILITSRPEGHISSVFNEARNHTKRILHDIEASVIQQDLRLYIHAELAKVPKKLNVRMAIDWVTDAEINTLVEKSGKLFVYAATSIRFISDDRVRDPPRQLRLILNTQTAQEVGARPYMQLDNLYMGVLCNSLSASNRQDILERFQVVVGSIILLREPLPLHSLARFVRYEIYKIDSALHHLSSVIIPPSNNDEAPRIYHPSFRDFMMDASRCTEVGFLIVPVPEQEWRHAIRCFELMTAFLKQDVAGISDLSLLNNEVDGFEQKVRDALSPEVQYACRYWASHLLHVEFGDKAMVEALEAFSMGSILVWFEAMSLIGSISNSASSIQEAHQWAMSSKCNSTVVTILSDAYRFILTHAEVIRASALHVYHSALAFTPHDTALYKAYSQDTNHPINVLQGVESQWQRNLSTLVGHSDGVKSVAFSPDGLRLASGSLDRTLRLWNAISGAHIATLEGHSNEVNSVAFSPDGLRLASGSDDHTLRLWDAVSGMHIATLEGHSDKVKSVAFSPDGVRLASGSYDHTLRLWDVTTGALIASLEGHSDRVISVAFSPIGLRLASGSRDCTLRLWDATSGAHITTLRGHFNSISSIAFSPDGLRLASGSNDYTLRLWDAMSGAHIATLKGHSTWVTSIAFSPDGLRLASCPYTGPLHLWDVMSSTHTGTLRGHSKTIWSVAFSPDGLQLASGSDDCTLRLWDVSGAHFATPGNRLQWVRLIAFSPDGLRLASGSYDGTLRLWDAMSGSHITTLEGHSDRISSVAFSPDSLRLASGSNDNTLRLWDALSGACIATLEGHSDLVGSVAFSPDGLRLASGSYDRTLRLWDVTTGALIASLEGHSRWVTSVKFAIDSHTLISRAVTETFTWDLTTSPPHRLDSGSHGPVAFPPIIGLSSLFWSSNGPWIQVQHPQENHATRICYIPTHYQPSTAVEASSPNNELRVAVGCEDGRVIILDIQHHPFVRRLRQVAM